MTHPTVYNSNQQIMQPADFERFIDSLTRANEGQTAALSFPAGRVLCSANDEYYLPLHNGQGELTGIKSVDEHVVIHMGAEAPGFFLMEGSRADVILMTDDVAVAKRVHQVIGCTVALLGDNDDIGRVSEQLTTASQAIILYGTSERSDVYDVLVQHGISPVDCSNESELTSRFDAAVERANLRIPKGFSLKSDGVYVQKRGKDGSLNDEWLCSPMVVTALTRDIRSETWGRYIELDDHDGVKHQFAMPAEQLTKAGFIQSLVCRGLVYQYGKESEINRYLFKSTPIHRARSVAKTGWYEDMFVLPERVIGDFSKEKVVLQNQASPVRYDESGSLEQWQTHVAALCVGNSRLAFGVSVAFATMLLKLVDGESGGFHFRSGSSRGKTTILATAQSVFGSSGSLPRWRATVDGLEDLATSHNHTLLCLDEFGQLAEVSAKKAGEAIYMLGNGEGKQRSHRSGHSAERSSWQLLYLSAGEVSLKSVMDAAGLQVRGGQEVRFIDLPADADAGLGVFNTIGQYADGNQFALAIKEGALAYYGTAAVAFLECVSSDYQGTKIAMLKQMDAFMSRLNIDNADPQVHRVARRFAQVAAAGEIATEYGVTGWEEGEATRAAQTCFDAWIEARGGHGSQEEKQVLEQVSNKLLSWGLLRLNTAERAAARNGMVWGTQDENHIYVYGNVFKNQLCEGLDYKAAETILLNAGVLIPGNNRSTVQKKIDGKNVRVYKLDKKILELSAIEHEASEEIETEQE